MTPPRRFYANASHYAAQLALLDAAKWLRAAEVASDAHGRVFYAEHALSAAARVPVYLRKANLRKGDTRREYSAGVLAHQALVIESEAVSIVESTPLPPLCSEQEFCLYVFTGETAHV